MSWTTHPTTSQGVSAFSAPQLSSQSYLSRVPSLPETVYGTSQLYSQNSGLRPDMTSYYQTQGKADSLKATSSLGQHYFVDQMMVPHPYSSLYPGFDLNTIRRKNATRETTGPLKAWLSQHRKNPYPTKGEKVMLAIATRMTLTQVSTWFANARRRMKKDNLGEYEDDDVKEPEPERRDRSGSLSSRVSQTSSEADTSKELSDLSDIDEASSNQKRPAKKCVQRLFSPEIRSDPIVDASSSPESLPGKTEEKIQALTEHRLPPVAEMMRTRLEMVETVPQQVKMSTETVTNLKPKIWSISEIIGTASKAINAVDTPSYPFPAATQNQMYPDNSQYQPYGHYGQSSYQSQLVHNYPNFYPSTQTGYHDETSDLLNTTSTSLNTSVNSLNTSDSAFSNISDGQEIIQYL